MNKLIVLILLSTALLLLSKHSDINFASANEEMSVSQAVWNERLSDTMLQPVIIFTSIVCVSILVRGFKWI